MIAARTMRMLSLGLQLLIALALATMPLGHSTMSIPVADMAGPVMVMASGSAMDRQGDRPHGQQLGVGHTDSSDTDHAPCHACRGRVAALPPPPIVAVPAYARIATGVVYAEYRPQSTFAASVNANRARAPPQA